ncbi:MAG: hypothetical protein JWM74_4163 [Myxococcaceae bacterium]|nr:hypothetical protein [Myxococcaceae bacterium]
MSAKEIAQVAFEAYNASTGGKTYDGKAIPPWYAISPRIQDAWRAAARACVQHTAGSGPATVPELADDGDDQ